MCEDTKEDEAEDWFGERAQQKLHTHKSFQVDLGPGSVCEPRCAPIGWYTCLMFLVCSLFNSQSEVHTPGMVLLVATARHTHVSDTASILIHMVRTYVNHM